MNKNILNDKKEYLGRGIYAVVSKAHGFGTDALLLAYFSNAKRKDRACDLGTGCGIIPLLWCREGACKSISAVDIQEKAIKQLEKAIIISELEEGRIQPVLADLKEIQNSLSREAYDLVTINPPYKALNSGIKSSDGAQAIARHELHCSLNDAAKAANILLRFGGRFCICQRPERLSEVFSAMKANAIEPKRMRLVVQSLEKAPWLVLVEGRKGGRPGMTIEPNLALKNKEGQHSPEMLKVFGPYYENEFRTPKALQAKDEV
ncbi:MAG: methyltransferase [Clostridiales bacterium]|nr:methyltransferase [Clostridiales bacterium]